MTSISELAAQKKVLRREMLAVRRALSPAERKAYGAKICAYLLADERVKNAAVVLAYWAMDDEAPLTEFIVVRLAANQRVALPYIVGKGEMFAAEIDNPLLRGSKLAERVSGGATSPIDFSQALERGEYGIMTVRDAAEKIISPAEIGAILVPGTAFSPDGARLGMGGGFYDRYLIKAPQAYRLGIAFSCQILPNGVIPRDAFDQSVSTIFTENGIMEINL